MLSPYVALLRVPSARGFVLAGLVARLPISMIGVGTVLLVQNEYDSYALAGAAAAVGQVAAAVSGPALGRLTDRRGQSRMLPWQLGVHCLGLTGLLVASTTHAPEWTLFATSFLWGVAWPAIGSLVRSRWSHLLRGDPRLDTAFALEATLDEVVFVVGPVLVTLLATVVHPTAGLGTAVALTALGGAWFVTQSDSEPPGSGLTGRGESVLRLPGLLTVVAVGFSLGAAFAAMEVVVVAFAGDHGGQAQAAPVLALFSAGSLVAGIVCGSHDFWWTMVERLRRGSAILATATLPLLLAPNVAVLCAMVFLIGLSVAPVLIAVMGMTERLVPTELLTEGFALTGTAIAFGLSVGSLSAGRVVDSVDGAITFAVPIAGFVLAALFALRTVDRPAERGASEPLSVGAVAS